MVPHGLEWLDARPVATRLCETCAITIHTDTLNESGYVADSIAAMKGRTVS